MRDDDLEAVSRLLAEMTRGRAIGLLCAVFWISRQSRYGRLRRPLKGRQSRRQPCRAGHWLDFPRSRPSLDAVNAGDGCGGARFQGFEGSLASAKDRFVSAVN